MEETKGMHILHLPRWYPGYHNPQGGVFIQKQIESIKSGVQSIVFVTSSSNSQITYKKVIKSVNANVKTYYYYFNQKGLIYNSYQYCRGVVKCIRTCIKDSGKPSLLHAHVLLRTYIVAFIYNFLFGTKYIISEHWSGYYYRSLDKKNAIYRMLLKLTIRKASNINVVSERLKQSILLNIQLNEAKFNIIPNIATFISCKKTSKTGVVKMVSVADLKDDIKRISKIIEVFLTLKAKDFEYHIIGGGSDKNELMKLAGDKLDQSIFFYGELSNIEVLQALPRYDFLVVNSVYETFGVVALEALLSGLPIISTKTGCPEEIQVSDAGLFVNSNNNRELSEAISLMLKTYSEYDLKNIQTRIKELYSPELVGKAILNTYKTALS